jgi:hypothetical protein
VVKLGTFAYSCNSSYFRGGEDLISKPVQAKSSQDPISTNSVLKHMPVIPGGSRNGIVGQASLNINPKPYSKIN